MVITLLLILLLIGLFAGWNLYNEVIAPRLLIKHIKPLDVWVYKNYNDPYNEPVYAEVCSKKYNNQSGEWWVAYELFKIVPAEPNVIYSPPRKNIRVYDDDRRTSPAIIFVKQYEKQK